MPRSPAAQRFLKNYDKFTMVMAVLAVGMYSADYYLGKKAGVGDSETKKGDL